jgi:hypothetical protein
MDAAVLTTFIAPFLPFLLKGGEEAAKEAGKRMSGDTWEKAKAIWTKLFPKLKAKPAAREAAEDVANAPDDEDSRAALRLQLKKLLAEDKALAEDIAQLMQQNSQAEAGADNIQQQVIGNENKTVGKVEGQTIDFQM